jgi:uncharacterized membrane protein
MTTKSMMKVFGTLLFLFGIFGYLFPDWGKTIFSNNENLAHILLGLLLIVTAELPLLWQKWIVSLVGVFFLFLAIYGFSHVAPTDIHVKKTIITAHLDPFDNYFNLIVGLMLAWLMIGRLQTKK